MTDLDTLHNYANKFLGRVRAAITLDEFRSYVRNLEEDISTLSDSEASARISAVLAEVKKCDYVLRKDPDMKDSLVLPAAQKLVETIKDAKQKKA